MSDNQQPTRKSAHTRILEMPGKKGVEIARILLEEGYSIREASDAFAHLGYVSSIQPFTTDVEELHVSDRPMAAGLATAIASMEPRALPSVVWQKKSAK